MFDLENLEKTEHYQVPENYFDELPGRVMQNIKHEQHKRRTIISSAIAAVAVIAIAAGVFFNYNTPDKVKTSFETGIYFSAATGYDLIEVPWTVPVTE